MEGRLRIRRKIAGRYGGAAPVEGVAENKKAVVVELVETTTAFLFGARGIEFCLLFLLDRKQNSVAKRSFPLLSLNQSILQIPSLRSPGQALDKEREPQAACLHARGQQLLYRR